MGNLYKFIKLQAEKGPFFMVYSWLLFSLCLLCIIYYTVNNGGIINNHSTRGIINHGKNKRIPSKTEPKKFNCNRAKIIIGFGSIRFGRPDNVKSYKRNRTLAGSGANHHGRQSIYLSSKNHFRSGFGGMKSQLKRGQFQLTDLEVKALTETAFTPRDRLFIALMAGAGLRRSEVVNLRCDNVTNDPGLNITGKGNKKRFIPIKPGLYQEIKFYIGSRRGLVFPSRSNPHRPLTPRLLNIILKDIGRAAKIKNPDPEQKNINCHILRHTYARGLKNSGMSMESIQNILGHSSIKTTMDIYGLMGKNDIIKEFQKKVVC